MTISIILSVMSLCFCFAGFFFFRWYVARKIAASSLLTDYREEVYRLIAEIDAAADRDSLLVEERIKTLKQVIEDTDRRIAVYMRELQRSKNGEALYANLGRGIRAALDSRRHGEAAVEEEEAVSPQQNLPWQSLPEPKTPAAKKRAGKKNTLPEPEPAAPAKPKIKVQIAELSAQGLSPAEIASRLELSLAEVDLALNLLSRNVQNS